MLSTKSGEIEDISIIPGDGIGPEVAKQAMRDALVHAEHVVGLDHINFRNLDTVNAGTYLNSAPEEANRAVWTPDIKQFVSDSRCTLLGAMGDPRVARGGMAHAVDVILRTLRGKINHLGVRPNKALHPDLCHQVPVLGSYTKVVQLTQDHGIRCESGSAPDGGRAVFTIQEHPMQAYIGKIKEAAVLAKTNNVSKVTVVHKGNVLNDAHGKLNEKDLASLVEEIKKTHGVTLDFKLFDAAMADIVKDPSRIGVIVSDRVFGTVLENFIEAVKSGMRSVIDPLKSITILRQQSEGDYAKRIEGHQSRTEGDGLDSVGIQIGMHSEKAIDRHIRGSIDYAKKRGATEVGLLHMKSMLGEAYDLWLERAKAIADEMRVELVPIDGSELGERAVTSVNDIPDFLITCNLGGDWAADLFAALCAKGSLALGPSLNMNPDFGGEDVANRGFYVESIHGSGDASIRPITDSTGKIIKGGNVANPVGTQASLAMMFDALGFSESAKIQRDAIAEAIERGVKTRDLGGSASTAEFGGAVRRIIRKLYSIR